MNILSKMWSFGSATVAAAIIGACYLLLNRRRKAIAPPRGCSLDKQSVPVEGEKGVYKCGFLQGKDSTLTYLYPEVTTLYETFLRGLQKSENGPCLGERTDSNSPYKFLSYAQVNRQSSDFASALVKVLGVKPGNETNMGIYAKNSPKWYISSLGAISQSIVVVPLYDTLGADAATFIVNQAEIAVIVVDNVDKARKLIGAKSSIPTLNHVVVLEEADVNEALVEEGKQVSVAIHRFSTLLEQGAKNKVEAVKPKTDDTYIICYTSGTTGTPKGVMLSHKNVVANLTAFEYTLKAFLKDGALDKDDVLISYLPLSHMMEQMSHWVMIMNGASIGYFQGSIKTLTDDIKELRPTIMPVVPRLLNRMFDALMGKIETSGTVVKTLFNVAYSAKLSMLQKGVITNSTIWDKLVFGKIQHAMGGRLKIMATGSAPISDKVLETCRIAFGCTIIEAYGQTEATALAVATWPGDAEGGHCGGPAPCAVIKLADVCIKGPSVTKGYYKDEEKTAELFDEEGFLHTGDIGCIRENGSLKIIDRKKHIFKLAQGEYVAPEKIEQIYTRAHPVQQVYVDGDSLERWLIAVVVPETEVLQEWDEREHGNKRSIEEICRDDKAADFVLSTLVKIGKENKLNSIEQVKKVILEVDPFTVENGLLTPTLKAKRPQLRLKYINAMAAVYKANPTL
ncbi:acs-5 [Pristionchus pacificus]|uniref:Long-chain-fatty-acid--CoA ligase n=1 Tax=Pristionchus pacificus TaxID=54126 RepID=A0A2A6CHU5_PRIPA|nr:acs-5 [Pristionchus pacificus]|eukprot:PDM77660.1 acs-5 [Pristionchus pacificus]